MNTDDWGTFVKTHMGPFRALARQITHHQQDTEDAVQEAFTRIFTHWPELSLKLEEHRINSMRKIVKNCAIDACRKRGSKTRTSIDPADGHEDVRELPPGAALIAEEVREHVWQAMNLLSPGYKEILLRRFWQGLSYKSIAVMLGVTEDTVNMRLHHAKNEVRRLLGYDPFFDDNQ
jgi:RNA polymerase sigma-70 factor (ECF subfamily)